MSLAPPPKVKAGDPIVCAAGHQVGSVLNIVPLASPILAADVSIANGKRVGNRSDKVQCAVCERPAARISAREHWSVRLDRSWVK